MNIKNKTKKIFIRILKSSQKCKGFSLIEMSIAAFIFAFAITMLMGSFSSFNKVYANVKGSQKKVEEAQFAMNLMAKTLRTSGILESAGTGYTFLSSYDYSQGQCIRYRIEDNSITEQFGTAGANPPSTCVWSSHDSRNHLISEGAIVGSGNESSFSFLNTSSAPLIVVIKLGIQDGKKITTIQTAVHLRFQQ